MRRRSSAFAFVGIVLAAVVTTGCAAGSPSARASTSASPSVVAPSAPGGSASAQRCLPERVVDYHQVPDVEALLPAKVGGRQLSKWSVGGRCLIEIAFSISDDQIDALIAKLDSEGVDVAHLAYGVAGRSETSSDPAYFVFAMARPQKDAEIEAAMGLLFGLIGFTDLQDAPDLTRYDKRSIADHTVYVGDTGMLRQDEHQRGRPYLYQTDDDMFLIVTDDEGWAQDAISQLP